MNQRVYVSFDECKQKISLPEVLDVLGIADRFRRQNGTLTSVCPFPDHVHGPCPNPEQFKVNQVDGIWLWRCWGDCQAAGNVVQFVMRMTGLSAQHVRFWFAEHFGDRLTLKQGRGESRRNRNGPEKKEARPEPRTPERAQNVAMQQPTLPDPQPAYKPIRFKLRLDPDVPYLRDRGLSPEIVSRYGLGLCSRGMLAGYVAIPVWDFPHGEYPVGYLGRWPGEDYDPEQGRPRYKWPPGFPKHRFLFGLQEALEATDGEPLLVVEGVFDAMHCVQHGYAAAVATFGSSLSDEQAQLLADTGRSIILMYDGNDAGRDGAITAAAKLIRSTFVRIVTLDDDQQPDDLTAAELQELLSCGCSIAA